MSVCTRLMTRAEYYRAAECGIFRPEERLELIDGEVICKVSPQKRPHAIAILRITRALSQAFGENHLVQPQMPLILNDFSEPEPDVAVYRGREEDYFDEHPATADVLLIVEVSDATLASDRQRKAALYARAGIQDYWIVNLQARSVEVHRDPVTLPDGTSRYDSVSIVSEGETVSPLAAPESTLEVARMIPPPGKTAGEHVKE